MCWGNWGQRDSPKPSRILVLALCLSEFREGRLEVSIMGWSLEIRQKQPTAEHVPWSETRAEGGGRDLDIEFQWAVGGLIYASVTCKVGEGTKSYSPKLPPNLTVWTRS